MDKPQGWYLAGGGLAACSPFDALDIPDGRHVISLVGGGGKTTLLHYLAGCFAAQERRTAVMTTTRMGCPSAYCETIEACRAYWEKGEYAAVGQRLDNGKFRAPAGDVLASVLNEAEIVLVEADGAHRRPLKFPAENEPVILPETDIVIAVCGLDALHAAAGDVCHRMPEAKALLGIDEQHIITAEDIAAVLLSPQGGKKGASDRLYITALNKCDDEARKEGGEAVLRLLDKKGHTHAALLHFPPENRTGL